MKNFRADLHIHTTLSPCGDLGMSPVRIIKEARRRQLDIIGITDHNTTRQCSVVKELAQQAGIFTLCGAEINSREEVHCLAFFETQEKLKIFQYYLDQHLPPIPNNVDYFGYQVAVDAEEHITYQEKHLLLSALDVSINEIEKQVHQLNGIFIPAHINRPQNGLLRSLGFLPSSLRVDALEISYHSTISAFRETHPELNHLKIIQSSDAHHPDDIGKVTTSLDISSCSFANIKKWLNS